MDGRSVRKRSGNERKRRRYRGEVEHGRCRELEQFPPSPVPRRPDTDIPCPLVSQTPVLRTGG